MSQSSASYRILAIRRAWNLKITAMQAMVKQTAFAAMTLGAMLSCMCISCSSISAGVGKEAMLSEIWKCFHYAKGNVYSERFEIEKTNAFGLIAFESFLLKFGPRHPQ